MNAPVEMLHTVRHCGRVLRARVLCDVWMYTDSDVRIMRGDIVGLEVPGEAPIYYSIEAPPLATGRGYQKFRVAKLPPIL